MLNWRKPIIYSLLYLSGSKIPENLNYIKSFTKNDPEKICIIQNNKLRNILIHSYSHVPYYHNILKNSGVINNKDTINLNNFQNIPILTKNIIRNNFNALKSKDISIKKRNLYSNTSGGSTGEPAKFIQDRFYSDWNIANKIYYKLLAGQQIGEKELRLWGSREDTLFGKDNIKTRLKNWLYNRKDLNSFKMSEEDMYDYAAIWNRFKPSWVEAYVESAYEFSKFILKNKLSIHPPRYLLTTAGTLYPEMEKTISNAFKCNVLNRYGSREVGDMACSCTNNNHLHLSPFNHYIELLDKNFKPVINNELGRIYVTTLNNYSMPLIRYDIGDLGKILKTNDHCACGNNNSSIKEIYGRTTDLFINARGDKIDGAFFRHLLFYRNWISKYQIIQESHHLIIYKIKIQEQYKPKTAELNDIKTKTKKVMGNKCIVRFDFVKEINPLDNGKYLYTYNKINR